MSGKVYLRPNVVVEPLVAHWYAWSHLIAPATAARNFTDRHLRIIDSFVQSPAAHAAAVQNPKMLGGPFMDLPASRVDQVKQLGNEIRENSLFELSSAICQLEAMLKSEAQGFSVEPLYSQVPQALRGYVELVYDRQNHPHFRLLEALVYKSRFYQPELQSLMLSLITGDDRPFVLSTPRFQEEGCVEWQVPFASENIDKLFAMKTRSEEFETVQEILGVNEKDSDALRSLFRAEPTASANRYAGKGARWRYFGHACILMEADGVSLLTDPVLSYTYENNISRYTYEDLPDVIDCVMITHNHQDHLLFETLLQLRSRIRTIVVPRSGGGDLQDPSMKLILQQCGFKNVVEMQEMESMKFGKFELTALPFLGEHGDLDVRTKLAYLARINGKSILFAADSANISPEMYRHVHAEVGDIDVLFVGMECDGAPMSWLYGPLFTEKLERSMDQSRRLAGSNFERAKGIVDQFNCKEVYVYAMGQEPWLNYVMSVKYTEQSNPIIQSNRLIEACRDEGRIAERLFGEREILLG